MPKLELVLNVQGGVLQEVFASDPDIELILVDWDVEGHSLDQSGVVATELNQRPLRAYVTRPNAAPLYLLAGSAVEAVIEAAEQGELAHGSA